MNKKEIMKLLEGRIESCFQQLLEARNNKYMEKYIEGFRCRLDELLLLYQTIEDKSFIDVCKDFEINYEYMNYQKEAKEDE